MTEIVTVEYTESVVDVTTCDDIYTVVTENNAVEVCISDVILKEVVEYLPEEDEVYDIEVDTSIAGVTYVGQAQPGTAKGTAAWRIKKITDSAGGSSVDWANGNAEFINIWDNRLSYTYGP